MLPWESARGLTHVSGNKRETSRGWVYRYTARKRAPKGAPGHPSGALASAPEATALDPTTGSAAANSVLTTATGAKAM